MRFPVIVAQENLPIPPAPHAQTTDLALRSTEALGQSLALIGERTGAEITRVQNALLAQDMKLNLVETMSALKDEYAQREIETRRQLGEGGVDPQTGERTGGLDPTQYHPTMAKAARDLLTHYEGQLKYPGSAAPFRSQALAFLTEQNIKARFEGFKLQQAGIETRDGVLTDRLITDSVIAPTEEARQAAFSQALDLARAGVESGRYSGDQGAAKIRHILTSVERGTALRDFKNSDLSAGVVTQLVTGTYSRHMSPEEQFTLGKTLQNQADQDYTHMRTAMDKWWTAQQQAQVSDLFAAAANKTLDLGQLERDRVDWRLTREDYHAIRAEAVKPADELASDRTTLDFVIADTHSQYPRSTERSLKTLHDAGQLNTKDWTSALDRMRETKEALLNKAESQRMATYHDGLTDLQNRLGVPTLWEKLDPVQKKVWSLAQQDYRRRAWPLTSGAEPPRAVVEDLGPKYLGMIGTEARMDKERLLGFLRQQGNYTTPQQVQTDFMAGKMSAGKRDSLLNLFNEIKAKQDLEDQAQTQGTTTRAQQFGRPSPQ